MSSIVEDIEAISVNGWVFIFIGLSKHDAGQPSKATRTDVKAQKAGDEQNAHHQNHHQTEDDPLQAVSASAETTRQIFIRLARLAHRKCHNEMMIICKYM